MGIQTDPKISSYINYRNTYTFSFFVPNRSPPPPLDAPQPGLKLDRAQSFRDVCAPGVESVLRRGKFIIAKVRPDGNCFFMASTTGVLLWAVCQSGPEVIRGVHARFKAALEPPEPKLSACKSLPEDLEVGVVSYHVAAIAPVYVPLPSFNLSSTSVHAVENPAVPRCASP